jgi:hypothetical protein
VAIHLQWPTADPLFAGTNGTYLLRGLDGGQDGTMASRLLIIQKQHLSQQSKCQDVIRCLSSPWFAIRGELSMQYNVFLVELHLSLQILCPGRNCAIDRALGEANPHAFARHVHLPSEGMTMSIPLASFDCGHMWSRHVTATWHHLATCPSLLAVPG